MKVVELFSHSVMPVAVTVISLRGCAKEKRVNVRCVRVVVYLVDKLNLVDPAKRNDGQARKGKWK